MLSCLHRAVLEVRLSLLERSSRRRLRIRSAEVEKCPPKYLALGSGEPDVNGSYTLRGFRNRAPWYENSEGVVVTKEPLPPQNSTALTSPGTTTTATHGCLGVFPL